MVATVQAPPALLTSADLEERYGDERVELWRGVVVEKSPTRSTRAKVAYRLGAILSAYTMRTESGEIWPEGTGFTIEVGPDTVVAPDLSFVPADVAPTLNDDEPGFPRYVPPLVVEIKSPGDSERAIAEKLSLYLAAGVGEVWWVRPRARTLTRHWPDRDPLTLGPGDTLDDVDALPGLSLRVDDIFPPEPSTTAPSEGAS